MGGCIYTGGRQRGGWDYLVAANRHDVLLICTTVKQIRDTGEKSMDG